MAALYLSTRRRFIKTPLTSHSLHCLFFINSSSANSDESISDQNHVIDGTEKVRFSGGNSFPFSRLLHSSHRQARLPQASVELLHVNLGFRGFSNISSDGNEDSDEEIESECGNDEEDDEIRVNRVESVELLDANSGFRGFCSSSSDGSQRFDEEIGSECNKDEEDDEIGVSCVESVDANSGFRGFSSSNSDGNGRFDEEIGSECDHDEEDDEIGINCVNSVELLGFSSSCSDGNGRFNEAIGSDEEDDEIRVSSVDAEEVDRICKVIDELFAIDRNMESVLDEMKLDLSSDLIISVLERFKHARKPAFRFFNWCSQNQQQGYVHDSRTYNKMMSILAKTRQFETMVSILEEMGEKELLNMDTFTIAMKAFAASKERKKAVGIFELMKKYKFKIGVDTINCLLDSLGRAKLGKEAQVLFDKLKERFTPNVMTYTVLLNGWCRVRNLVEAGRIWNMMIDSGLEPDIVTHNVMLEGLLRSRKKSDAIKLFHVMKSKGPYPNVRSYTIMIRDFCKQSDMETAVEYFDEMVGDLDLKPDAAVYTCLITGFGNQKKIDIVYELLKEMRERGHLPDGKTYNALIKLMANRKLPEHASRIYKKMIENGIEPTIHTFNMLMKAYFNDGDYESGKAVWEEMMKKGICGDDNSYTVLIRGLIREGKSREACRYLEEMIDKGMKTPLIDYNKFAADFGRGGEPEIFEELSRRAKFSGKFVAAEIFARWGEMTRRKFKQRFM